MPRNPQETTECCMGIRPFSDPILGPNFNPKSDLKTSQRWSLQFRNTSWLQLRLSNASFSSDPGSMSLPLLAESKFSGIFFLKIALFCKILYVVFFFFLLFLRKSENPGETFGHLAAWFWNQNTQSDGALPRLPQQPRKHWKIRSKLTSR